jgi:hypothetical protein
VRNFNGGAKSRLGRLSFEKKLPRGLLYHYTSLEGLLGIIQSESIRATHVRCLNDHTEFRNAFDSKYTEALIKSLDWIAKEKPVAEWFARLLPQDKDHDAFLTSFTDDEAVSEGEESRPGDRLSQWRAYASGSGGFSLGFDSTQILAGWNKCPLKATKGRIRRIRCLYSAEDKEKIIREIGAYSRKYLQDFLAEEKNAFVEEKHREPNEGENLVFFKKSAIRVLAASFVHYFSCAGGFKDEAFSEEHEWRILFVVNRQNLLEKQLLTQGIPIIHFRSGRFGVTPFIELPLGLTTPNSPLRRIVIGPSPHEDEAVRAVEFLLASRGIKIKTKKSPEGVEVLPSQIPYRNW